MCGAMVAHEMLGFHEKRKLQRLLHSRTMLVLLCIPIVFLGYVTYNARVTEEAARERKSALAEELAAVEERASALAGSIETLKDPRGVEAELRKRYEVGWKGEEAIILLDDGEEEQPAATRTPVVEEKAGMWARFLDIVF